MHTDSKVLYGLLLDRVSLSIKNHWIDEQDRVFIIYTRAEAQEVLNVKGEQKITKLFKELKDYGLIEEHRQGLTKPNLIYVLKFIHEPTEEEKELKLLKNKETVKNKEQESRKTKTIYTDINQTDISIKSVSLEEDQRRTDGRTDNNKKEIEKIFEAIEADLFQDDSRKAIKTAIIGLWHKPFMEIQGTRYEQQQIRNMLQSLTLESIDHAIFKLRQQHEKKPIANKAKYLQACIVTASIESPADNCL